MGKTHRALAFLFRIRGMTGRQDVMEAGQARALWPAFAAKRTPHRAQLRM